MKLGIIYSYEKMNEDYCTEDDPEGKNVYCKEHRRKMLAAIRRKKQEIQRLNSKSYRKKQRNSAKKTSLIPKDSSLSVLGK